MTAHISTNPKNLTPEGEKFLNGIKEIQELTGQKPIDPDAVKERLLYIQHSQDAISLLKDFIPEMDKLNIDKLANAIKDAQDNNLIVSIVGTMKAGKSSLLKNIFGYNITPSRNSACTSIPTWFEYAPHLKQPRLEISEDFNENMQRGLELVRTLIRDKTLKTVQSKKEVNSIPQVKAILKKIQEESLDELLRLPAEGDSEQILNYLEKVNDYHRVFSILKIGGITITNYPKIFTPFAGISKPFKGTCTFIDTAGRDDTSASKSNNDGFDEVLNRSQKTFLIVNFLRDIGASEFENNIKPLCQTIINQRDKNNLIVVVNQIDGRGSKSDTTTEQIVELFQTEFDITPKQIIEVSALKASMSSDVRRDLSIYYPSVPLKQIPSVQKLAQKAYGVLNWEQFLDKDNSLDEVRNFADKIWKESGFVPLVEAIQTMIEESEKNTVSAALKAAEDSLDLCLKEIESKKQDLESNQKNLVEKAALQLREIADIVTRLENLRAHYVNHFRETYENETATILSSSLKFYNADEAKNHLEQSKQDCLRIADRVWNTIQQDLINNFQEVQQQIIDRGKELGLEFQPVTLDGCTIAFSIDELLDPLYEPEEYQTNVAVPKTKLVTEIHRKRRLVKNQVWPFEHWVWEDVEVEVPFHYTEIETITNTRDVFVLQRNHKDRTIALVNSQVGNCLESPALKEALSLSTFKVQLDQHLTKTAEDYESNLRSSILLQSRAKDQLATIQADLDVVNS